ncbi:hypothetical protein [Roseivirga misakiensis]|uniref:Glycosyltransferase RgtA/B/C/D-like domain-containing protein n=1 Tax=Roseivirga misakiensis TaxID=1563681 RepID=A0A1E5T1F3_9BACT|nr:hypothetical protein [Roseivirga misakiensis]OEK05200.1 hypothetical protein BFP71_17505 [Roseivirga misakiensis]
MRGQGGFELPGLFIAIVLFTIIVTLVGYRNIPSQFRGIMGGSIFLRIIGVLAYSFVVFSIYSGAADPVVYFRWGQRFADYFKEFSLEPFFNSDIWRGPALTGTNFVGYPAAFAILLVGESFRGTWLLYSSLCLIGLFFFAKVFFRAYGGIDYKWYLTLVLLYPSLWFWTASISKDTWMIFGVAVFLTGMVSKKRKQSIYVMAFGLLWCYLVRPQVAAILAFSLAGSYFLGSFKKFTFQNVAILVLSVVGALYFLSVVGVNEVTEVTNYATDQRAKSSYGGSQIQLFRGPLAFIFAPVNILLRPFPWEVRSALQVISFFDIYFIWFLALRNRKAVFRAIRMIQKDRLVAFSLIFIILFSVGAGLALSNLGLIARQRIILYPFMFIIIYAYSDKRVMFLAQKKKRRREEKLREIAALQKA